MTAVGAKEGGEGEGVGHSKHTAVGPNRTEYPLLERSGHYAEIDARGLFGLYDGVPTCPWVRISYNRPVVHILLDGSLIAKNSHGMNLFVRLCVCLYC